MIKKISFVIFLVTAFCGCQQKMTISNEMEGKVATVNFNVPLEQTKSTTMSSESAVNSLQIFVFGADGKIDAYGIANTKTLSLTCTTGQKDIIALVNAIPQTGIQTLTDLLNRKSDLKDNSSAGLVMVGRLSTNLTSNSTVSVPVTRRVARVSLKSVVTAFDLDVYKNQEFKIKKVSLINVPGDNFFLKDGLPSLWYNKLGDTDSLLQLLSDTVADVVVNEKTPYNTQHYFYCYPNSTAKDVSGGTWSPRYTRLVVSATIGGVLYHYPMSIPNIESNKCYDVSLKVTRPGSSSVDIPVVKISASFNVSVQDWAGVSNIDEII